MMRSLQAARAASLWSPINFLQTCIRAAHTTTSSNTMLRKHRGLFGTTHIRFGNSVAASHKKTKRTFKPNTHTHSYPSAALGRMVRVVATTRENRTVRKYGSIDAYLVDSSRGVQRSLGGLALKLRDEIVGARAAKKEALSIVKAEKAAERIKSAEQGAAGSRLDEPIVLGTIG